MPVFSIIIPTFKRVQLLQQALNSVLSQSFTNFECIVLNDEPADNQTLQELIAGFNDERFYFVPADKSNGGNYCRNKGIEMAKGDYIAFLDDDDIWLQSKLEQHYAAHQAQGAHLVYSTYISRWPDSQLPDLYVPGDAWPANVIEAIANGTFSIGTTSSATLKKSAIKGKLFDESLVSFQDWDAWLSFILGTPDIVIVRISEPQLYFVHHEASRTSRSIDKRALGLKQVMAKHKSLPGINGFYKKERLNIDLLDVTGAAGNGLLSRAMLLSKFLLYPPYWSNKFAIKRTGKFILTGK